MPAARAFRFRFLATRDELASFLVDRARSGAAGSGGIDVLSVPCGIPRELMEASALVRSRLGSWPCRIALHGLDLDAAVLDEARAAVAGSVDDAVEGRVEGGAGGGAAAGARPAFQAIHGNALSPSAYGKTFDFITCTGLTEFLDDTAVAALYGIFFSMLKPDGKLVTSGMTRRWTSDYLLRLGELQAHYRSADDLRRLIGGLGFREVRTWHDATGLQTMMSASK
jgi:chemotaxis methyl-accepting protein methylase